MKIKQRKYFAYVRVSTIKQGEGASLEAQTDAIQNYAENHGLTISDWFEEKETAAKLGRPIFTRMIKLLKSHKANGLIMHKIDRSARNLRDWATIGDLQDDGIDVHFSAESVDFASRGGRLTADIQAVIAADFIRNLKEEIRKGQKSRLKQGYYPFSAPFGYLDNGKGNLKTIDPERGKFVQKMYELYATGQFSLPLLETEMFKRGLRTASGYKVYKGKIELILANPFYMGVIKLKEHSQIYEGLHEALISPELFRKVQEVKQNRSRRKRTKHNYLYRGIFSCKTCTKSMIPERQRGHVYYRCHTVSCPSNCIREDALESAIIKLLSKFNSLKAKHLNSLQKQMQHQRAPTSKNTIRLELAKIEGQLEKLLDAYMSELINETDFAKKKETLEFRKIELKKQVTKQVSIAEKTENIQRFLEHIKCLANTYVLATSSEKRQLIDIVFSNMCVQDKKVEITTQNWIESALKLPISPKCADYRVENRSGQQFKNLKTDASFLDIDNYKMRQILDLTLDIKNTE